MLRHLKGATLIKGLSLNVPPATASSCSHTEAL